MSYWDYQELLLYAIGKTESEADELINDDADFDAIAYEHFNVDFEQFMEIAEKLLPLTPMIESSLTKKLYHSFVRKNELNSVTAIVKVEVEQNENNTQSN